jgi:hypothetical protein
MMDQYQRGLRDIREWLQVNHPKHIDWKIDICLDNYPHDKPQYHPYYDAMLDELRKAKEEVLTHNAL